MPDSEIPGVPYQLLAQFGLAFLRALHFRFDPKSDSYIYEGPYQVATTEVIRAMEKAGG